MLAHTRSEVKAYFITIIIFSNYFFFIFIIYDAIDELMSICVVFNICENNYGMACTLYCITFTLYRFYGTKRTLCSKSYL